MPHFKFSPGKLRKRIYAFSIDLMIIGVAQKLLILSYLNFLDKYLFSLPLKTKITFLNNLQEIHFPTIILCFWSYHFLCNFMSGGQTLGKKFFNLKVTARESKNKELKPELMAFRSLTLCFSYFTIIPLFSVYLTKDNRGLWDILSQSHTYEIEESTNSVLNDGYDRGHQLAS